jgi:excisionase family DNA binding protein
MSTPTTGAAAEPIWLTIEEAAARIRVTPRTFARYETDGHITAHRLPGGGKRYRPEAVDALASIPVPGIDTDHAPLDADVKEDHEDE